MFLCRLELESGIQKFHASDEYLHKPNVSKTLNEDYQIIQKCSKKCYFLIIPQWKFERYFTNIFFFFRCICLHGHCMQIWVRTGQYKHSINVQCPENLTTLLPFSRRYFMLKHFDSSMIHLNNYKLYFVIDSINFLGSFHRDNLGRIKGSCVRFIQ